ncbi:hypothetical protein [Actinomadura sediminis]|uniref:Uncharacterized protein n=1 Tax=Actinomadura sediminis TaxID=1038904 RepID=A0ABW3EQ95_9ACTN
MKVRMKVAVSGTRNGRPWPHPGEVVELSDAEGADLCASGVAEPVAERPVETATAPEPEKRDDADAGERKPQQRRTQSRKRS